GPQRRGRDGRPWARDGRPWSRDGRPWSRDGRPRSRDDRSSPGAGRPTARTGAGARTVRGRRPPPYLLLVAFAALLVVPAWMATVAAGLAVAVTAGRAIRSIAGRGARAKAKPADAIVIGGDTSGREMWI